MDKDKIIIFVEPFYGGSHKQLVSTLADELIDACDIITLPAKKWPWRARCGALRISQLISTENKYETLFCSSVLNLSELLGIRADLQKLRKIIYFHENQLIYPKQQIKERDFQFGYNQLTSCLAADIIIFNSYYNMHSFLNNIQKFLKIMPDCRPVDLRKKIETKSRVMYFPLSFSQIPILKKKDYNKILHIVWPHRWEFDKGPDDFFDIVLKLKELKTAFKLSVIGETFTDVPDVFHKAKIILEENILHWGYIESKDEYYKILNMAHVVLSTAKHEFYGVAMLEATYCGCFPLLPNALVYPEIYDEQCLYKDTSDAVAILKEFSENVLQLEQKRDSLKFDFSKYSSTTLIPQYIKLLTTQ